MSFRFIFTWDAEEQEHYIEKHLIQEWYPSYRDNAVNFEIDQGGFDCFMGDWLKELPSGRYIAEGTIFYSQDLLRGMGL